MPTDYKQATLDELAQKGGAVTDKLALAGFDGFVDRIIHAVARRNGPRDDYEPFPTLAAFGQCIVDAAGKSTGIELYVLREQLGGNGPLMARALLAGGMSARYIGALGQPAMHPLFAEFARHTQAISVGNPCVTHALEFPDGKLMLSETANLAEMSYPGIVAAVGEGMLLDLLAKADLVALNNWTKIPHMSSIYEGLLTQALPTLSHRPRHFYFDLADPNMRPREELRAAVMLIGRFQNFGNATLGLNFLEARQVAQVLGVEWTSAEPKALQLAATRMRNMIGTGGLVIHPVNGAACATRDGSWWVDGPVCEKPAITTGGGDNFNAGFALGQVLGLSPPCCLTLAVAFSGHYVRYARSPSLAEAATFIRSW